MKLDHIKIKNFRSIEEIKLDLDPACRVLVGINESGKSNILKALSLLGDHKPSKKDDVREALPDEDPIEEATVSFCFSLDKEETGYLYESALDRVIARDIIKTHIVTAGKLNFNLKSFVGLRNKGLYDVNLITEQKAAKYWGLGSNYLLVDGWKKPSAKCPDDFEFEKRVGEKVKLKTIKLIYAPDYKEIPVEYLEGTDAKNLASLIGTDVTTTIEECLPETLFWQYSEENLLPGSVKLDAFIANPDSCLPLKNMFILAGIEDIPTSINDAKNKSRNSLHNFFKTIADKTTTHFRSVWKEHKTIEFELAPDGENIIPGVREKNRYDFQKRSDGFKRFVSFLLLISAKVKSGELKDTLLLIDEPDASLHPSGARFLRDELIRISKLNYVVYSTHSIFMIDREDIGRHVIVTKKDEKTSVSVANDSNIVDEEVIYNALGYSIFESLKKQNVIFEGWKDKHLFQIAMKKIPSSHSVLKNKFKDVGVCHAKGVKHIKSITPIMELADRECLIVSDGDAPAKEKQNEYASIGGYGVWKRYDELFTTRPIRTGEDFVKIDAYRSILKELKSRYASLPVLDEAKLSDSQGKLYILGEWLKTGGLDKETQENEIRAIKDKIFDDLTVNDIEPDYFDFLVKLSELL